MEKNLETVFFEMMNLFYLIYYITLICPIQKMSTTCQQLVCFDNGRIWVEGLAGQINLSPWWFQLPSVLGSSTVVVDSLFIVAPIGL